MSTTYYHKIIQLLGELKRDHPSLNLGKHLATSLDGIETKYLWGLTDKNVYHALQKYQISLDLDVPHDESEIEKILRDGMRISNVHELNDDDTY